MNLTEKILFKNLRNSQEEPISSGDIVIIKVDRTLASEVTLVGINERIRKFGVTHLFDNSKFFLSIDHMVDPSNYEEPAIKKRIMESREFAQKFSIVDFFDVNQSILHTEFYRQRALPNTVIVGADSHTCSHGCVGALSMGMGATDVVLPLITGCTWLKVPEVVCFEFIGKVEQGIVGKDIMLYLLKIFKRNTIALDRVCEFVGSGLEYLSIDDRFAIANMCTEFGAITGVFICDDKTIDYLSYRPNSNLDSSIDQLRPDQNCRYHSKHVINLSEIGEYQIALCPSPDNVFLVKDVPTMSLDGVFIGACTTTESEMILAALVLKVGRDILKLPINTDGQKKRQITPGSSHILSFLKNANLIKIFTSVGYKIGAPGCSYCIGMGADVAGENEVWLSSQNRNFKNRMGKGSIGHITSAVVVASSSFSMTLTDPSELIKHIDWNEYYELCHLAHENRRNFKSPTNHIKLSNFDLEVEKKDPLKIITSPIKSLTGKVSIFGDSVDTDQIIPAKFIPLRGEELANKSFYFADPDFVRNCRENEQTIIVAGCGFGCGSSREEAVTCLKYLGVKAVIAKSFSFIYYRNLLYHSLLGIVVDDPSFYENVSSEDPITIDLDSLIIKKGELEYSFDLPQMVKNIYTSGGLLNMFETTGDQVFDCLNCSSSGMEIY